MKTEEQLSIAQNFINEIAFHNVAFDNDNFLVECKSCGRKDWQKRNIKHKRTCKVGKILDGYY